MTQEYFALKQHPDVISHIGGVIEIPDHVTSADIPVNYWCESLPCKYTVKATGKVPTTCPRCGKDTVAKLPF